jgi:hypothetical protein
MHTTAIRVRDPHDPDEKGVFQDLNSHKGLVGCLAFAPKGYILVSGGAKDDHTVRVWNAANGNERRTFAGHPGGVTALAFATDGNTLASAGADGTVKLWDARPKEGKLLKTLSGHKGKVVGVAFMPDGKTVISIGADRTARFWDAGTGNPVLPAKGWPRQVAIRPHVDAVSRDGSRMLLAGERHTMVFAVERERATVSGRGNSTACTTAGTARPSPPTGRRSRSAATSPYRFGDRGPASRWSCSPSTRGRCWPSRSAPTASGLPPPL